MAHLGPLPDSANTAKIRLVGKMAGGANWANVLHAKTSGALTTATLNTIATAIKGYWSSDLAPQIHNTVSLTLVEVTDLTNRTGAQGTDTTGANGTAALQVAPNNVAACLTLKIVNRYRGGHPRMYLPGVRQDWIQNGNQWTSGTAAAYQAAGRAFLAHINSIIVGSTTWQMAAISYYHKVGGVEAYKIPPDVYVISDVVVHGRPDSMRRRLGKETA